MRFFLCLSVLCCFSVSQAQIHVHEEPIHELIFENEYLYVMDIKAKPGQASLPHAHKHNYCYQAFQGGKMKLINADLNTREVNLPSGYTGGIFTTHQEDYIHAFQNMDSIEIQFLAVEHKSNIPNPKFKLKHSESLNIILENDFFAMAKIKMPQHTSLALAIEKPAILFNHNFLNIYITDKSSVGKKLREWAYIPPTETLQLSSLHEEDGEIVLIVVK